MPAGQPVTKSTASKRAKSSDAKRGAAVRKATNTGTMKAAASVSPDKPLTEKQLLFAREYARGNSVANAMARAGYSTADYSLGYRLIKMPNVLKVIDAERRAFEEENAMSRRKVMDMLLESYDMAKLSAEPASMVSAAREIGRLCGYYEPRKVQLDVTVQGSIAMGRLNALSDAELLRLIESGGSGTLLEGPESAPGDDLAASWGEDTPGP